MASKEKAWRECEVNALLSHYHEMTADELRALFPNRTMEAIRKKARKLNLHVPKEVEYKNRSQGRKGILFNGGVRHSVKGYKFILCKGHHRADANGYVAEHIYVWEKATGYKIPDNCVVHHLNGDKTDNRIENLCLMERGAHTVLHHTGHPHTDETRRKISEKAKARKYKDTKEKKVC